MKFEIIEDCSPYYIRYTHDGFDQVINMALSYKNQHMSTIVDKKKFMHIRLPVDLGSQVLDKVYCAKELQLIDQRVSLFVTQPNHYYRPHRDGLAVPMGINYYLDIRDDKCVTSWYDHDQFAGRPIDNLPSNSSREIADYSREKEKDLIKPVKSMVAKVNEVTLFNTDYFHDVDNTASSNERTILTLRSAFFQRLDFFGARKILFNF